MTNYLTVRGKDTAFPGKDEIKMADITDGCSHTIMAVEVCDAKAVPWTKPDDLQLRRKEPCGGARRPFFRRLQRGLLRRLGAVPFPRGQRRDAAKSI